MDLKTKRIITALRAAHSAMSPESMTPEDLERQRRGQKLLGKLVAPMLGMEWKPFSIAGMRAAWTCPEHCYERRRAVLYCHGGGYTSGNLSYSRILSAKLSGVSGRSVLSFEYRLAPERPYPAALEDAVKAWDYLMYQGYGARDIILAGDSAGGNLALVLILKLRQMKRQTPGALGLFSPWTDMTLSGPTFESCASVDPILTPDYVRAVRNVYAPGADYAFPLLSPLFGDFRDFPPTLIQAGENEILRSDSERLRSRMIFHGAPCRLEVFSDLWHVFQMFPMKKSGEAMEHVGEFLSSLY